MDHELGGVALISSQCQYSSLTPCHAVKLLMAFLKFKLSLNVAVTH